MTPLDIDLRPVDHISADALGQPGKRIFYLQGWQGERTITLVIEKLQLQTLAVGIEQFLAEVQEKIPGLIEELLAGTLISIHNLRALIHLMEQIRSYISDGSFEARTPELLTQWQGNAERKRKMEYDS